MGSGAASVAIFLMMALYLLQGKYLTGLLRPEFMLAFAALLFLQSLFALCLRVLRMKRSSAASPPALPLSDSNLEPEQVVSAALQEGYREEKGRGEGQRLLLRGVRRAVFLEAAAYLALLWTLSWGAVNYAVGVSGGLALAAGGEWATISGNLQLFHRGFAAHPERLTGALRVEKITPAAGERRSTVSFLYKGADDAVSTVSELAAGEVWEAPRGSIRYLGDAFLVQPLVVENEHDYYSKAVYLYPEQSGGRAIYRGPLDLAQPGSSGEVVYDPQSGRYRISVLKQGRLAGEGEFPFGGEWRGDGFYLRVNSYSHLARFSVLWNSYRDRILFGVAVLALAALLRLAARPRYLLLEEDGGGVRWVADSRKLSAKIRALEAGKKPL